MTTTNEIIAALQIDRGLHIYSISYPHKTGTESGKHVLAKAFDVYADGELVLVDRNGVPFVARVVQEVPDTPLEEVGLCKAWVVTSLRDYELTGTELRADEARATKQLAQQSARQHVRKLIDELGIDRETVFPQIEKK